MSMKAQEAKKIAQIHQEQTWVYHISMTVHSFFFSLLLLVFVFVYVPVELSWPTCKSCRRFPPYISSFFLFILLPHSSYCLQYILFLSSPIKCDATERFQLTKDVLLNNSGSNCILCQYYSFSWCVHKFIFHGTIIKHPELGCNIYCPFLYYYPERDLKCKDFFSIFLFFNKIKKNNHL